MLYMVSTTQLSLFDVWRARWADLVDFEVLAVIKSGEAARRVGTRPDDWPGPA